MLALSRAVQMAKQQATDAPPESQCTLVHTEHHSTARPMYDKLQSGKYRKAQNYDIIFFERYAAPFLFTRTQHVVERRHSRGETTWSGATVVAAGISRELLYSRSNLRGDIANKHSRLRAKELQSRTIAHNSSDKPPQVWSTDHSPGCNYGRQSGRLQPQRCVRSSRSLHLESWVRG